VLIDGGLVNSCLVPLLHASGTEITTIEGLAVDDRLHAVQQAFIDHGGAQCGICTPGMVLAAVALLDQDPEPDEAQIREGLAGNLCRCTGYMRIFEAVVAACRDPRFQGRCHNGAGRCGLMRSYPDYELREASTLDEALTLLAERPGEWRPFAGGTDLMVLLEAGTLTHRRFVSLWGLGWAARHYCRRQGGLDRRADDLHRRPSQ
jgi:xanthine dehydrogenase iron-sulfur cluster and FAD-binding subunit A